MHHGIITRAQTTEQEVLGRSEVSVISIFQVELHLTYGTFPATCKVIISMERPVISIASFPVSRASTPIDIVQHRLGPIQTYHIHESGANAMLISYNITTHSQEGCE